MFARYESLLSLLDSSRGSKLSIIEGITLLGLVLHLTVILPSLGSVVCCFPLVHGYCSQLLGQGLWLLHLWPMSSARDVLCYFALCLLASTSMSSVVYYSAADTIP